MEQGPAGSAKMKLCPPCKASSQPYRQARLRARAIIARAHRNTSDEALTLEGCWNLTTSPVDIHLVRWKKTETHTAVLCRNSAKAGSTSASSTARKRLNSSGEIGELPQRFLLAKHLPAMARFRQLRLYTTDVTLSVTDM